MRGRPQTNSHRIDGNTAWLDVSTPKHPGKEAAIDVADLGVVLDGTGRWSYHRGYVARYRFAGGDEHAERLHRVLMGLSRSTLGRGARGLLVDHVDGNPLNNRRTNLRVVTATENATNRRLTRGKSKMKGAMWDKERGVWISRIRVKGKSVFLGRFASDADAATAYDEAAQKFFVAHAAIGIGRAP